MISNAITYRFNGSARKITTPIGVSMPNGNSLEVVAVWDTGATNSVITLDVAKRLNLCSDKDIFATSCTAAIGCDVLIGMDIISMVDFAITSGQHGTTFSFKTPHGKEIDFMQT